MNISKIKTTIISFAERMMKHVMDNCRYSRDLMASWYGHFVYNGRVNSYSSRSCYYCGGV